MVRRSIVRRLVVQASILTTFVIVVLSTVGFILAKSVLNDVVHTSGMSLEMVEHTTEPGLALLSNSFAFIGTLLVCFAAATAFLLARQVTMPLRDLATKVGNLRPGESARRTVDTDDEVEIIDEAFVRMTARLAEVHRQQEAEISARTEDLRRQFKLDRAILESIHLGVVTVDRSGTIGLANPAALGMLQLDDVVGKAIESIVPLRTHGGEPIPGDHPVITCLVEGKSFRTPPTAHWSVERTDHSLLPISLSVMPLKDGEASYGAVVMFQNVSEERHIDYLKSEFITLASHQLRTPLSAIRWYAELLGDSAGSMGTEEKGYVEEIDRSVRRMITLLGALLNAARIEDETVRPTLVDVDLADLVRESVHDCEDVFAKYGTHPMIDVPRVPVTVKTDPVLIRVVIQNLLSNAAKYSSKNSSVAVRLSLDKDRVAIAVEDHGMGIPTSDQERIFEKFFRAQNVRQIDTDGNGLGLYISKSIIERLGGELSFVSTEGKGATFTMTVPMEVKTS